MDATYQSVARALAECVRRALRVTVVTIGVLWELRHMARFRSGRVTLQCAARWKHNAGDPVDINCTVFRDDSRFRWTTS